MQISNWASKLFIKPSPNFKARIGTHNGSFHCDEVLACVLLRYIPRFKEAQIVRSRDPEILKKCDVVVDVGGQHIPNKLLFDHHQRNFSETFSEYHTTKLSSAGLVYKQFGRNVLKNISKVDSETLLDKIFVKIYDSFIEGIDAIDNGIAQFDTKLAPRYVIRTDLSSRVSYLNPTWNSETKDGDAQFSTAMTVVQKEFEDTIQYYVSSWLPAFEFVQDALSKRHNIDQSGQIIALPCPVPWKEHLPFLETELKISPLIKYVIYECDGEWRVQAVPNRHPNFSSRKPLPEHWRGYRDHTLAAITDIHDVVFVHASGFIGGTRSFESALKMARMALFHKN